MKKIKYQGGLTKYLTSRMGEYNKSAFENYVNANLKLLRDQLTNKSISISLVSFSCYRDFYEQVLSILSFLRYAGTPVSWTIYSDGSHSVEQINLFESSFEFLEISIIDLERSNCNEFIKNQELLSYSDYLYDFAKKSPYGKKLFFYLNHKIDCPTIFLDSDILFYGKANFLESVIYENVDGWYLPDFEWGCLDSRYLVNHSKQMYQVNAGFFLLIRELETLKNGLEFLKSLDFQYEYFTEQSVFHVLFRSNGFMPFDSRFFVLNSGDQFDFSYKFKKEDIALRHYTGPVRHKMWQKDWKWQLSLY